MRRLEFASEVLVVRGAKVASLNRSVIKQPDDTKLSFTFGGQNPVDFIAVKKDFLAYNRFELWSELGNKVKEVSDFLEGVYKNQKDKEKRIGVMDHLLQESRGDRIVVLKIVEIFQKERWASIAATFSSTKKSLELRKAAEEKEREENEKRNKVCDQIDEIFSSSLDGVSSGFIELNKPLLTENDVNEIHKIVLDNLPITYKKISKELRNNHTEFEVVQRLLYNEKQRSQMAFSAFGLILAYAFHTEGGFVLEQSLGEWQGLATSSRSLGIDKRKRFSKFDEDLKVLKRHKNILTCWDNLKTSIKPLRFGKSQAQPGKSIYLDQRIPAPPGMFPFECLEQLNDAQRNDMIEELIWGQLDHATLLQRFQSKTGRPFAEDNDPSSHGKRVIWYQKVLKIARALRDIKRYLVSCKPEAVDLTPVDDLTPTGKENDENNVVRAIRDKQELCEKAKAFQQRTVASWNKFEAHVTKIFPLRSLIHKESSIEGSGNVLSENIEMSGFLKVDRRSDGTVKYSLGEKFEERNLVVAGNEMTVDVLLSFAKRMTKQALKSVGDTNKNNAATELADVLQAMFQKLTVIPGDFNFSVHQLDCLFVGFYGNWLQCFQYALECRTITADPKEKY
ncbi:unnamed protein product [Cylindrotheca closterium]|uniref:Uncharacterized protein n=1 Tax=Cylindrotheca closterium TaxID=2856 RepID=A0AAD2FR83_9STRA|nr:unnamed protein product [Cylindrotheca closterium]